MCALTEGLGTCCTDVLLCFDDIWMIDAPMSGALLMMSDDLCCFAACQTRGAS